MTKIIAFSGRKQSGKSTGGEELYNIVSKYRPSLKAKIYSFADPLKTDICMNILGMSHDQCYGLEEHKNTLTDLWWNNKNLTAREAMEIIGTEIFRKLKTSVWVDATINKILREEYDVAIIVDCRFPNEADSILNNGGYVVRLDLDPFHSSSISESALDPEKYDWNKFSKILKNSLMTIDQKNQAILNFAQDINIIL